MPDARSLEVDLPVRSATAGATVLDVRNPDEYESGHVPGAVLIPLDQLAARQDEIPDGDPLYVICAVGGRSLTATKALVEAGYRAVSVAGGTNGWIERGGRVVTGDRGPSEADAGPDREPGWPELSRTGPKSPRWPLPAPSCRVGPAPSRSRLVAVAVSMPLETRASPARPADPAEAPIGSIR